MRNETWGLIFPIKEDSNVETVWNSIDPRPAAHVSQTVAKHPLGSFRHPIEYKGKSENTKDALNLQDWAWRVIFFEASIKDSQGLYGRKARFDSIPEFLDWDSSWLDHLDARGLLRLQRHRAGCETDCEPDCELH
ncbi:hypothetical protein BDV39DRAFT_198975 [Aspergillus sergii]|uniref:Uncharacterized protein n=1 Tax=Aspergillus sergii TaxID=1034303 RepID=A0A5N6XLA7_9EURO|nr:hypothetical protein BDV39DRAFT_198975 [Aspergillus sergii]